MGSRLVRIRDVNVLCIKNEAVIGQGLHLCRNN
jgi:hypothetical protein